MADADHIFSALIDLLESWKQVHLEYRDPLDAKPIHTHECAVKDKKRKPTYRGYWRTCRQVISKGEIIRNHGRGAWDAIPRECVYQDGRRAYVPRTYVVNNFWGAELFL